MTDLYEYRYPVGPIDVAADTSASSRIRYIHTLRHLPEGLAAAVAGLDDLQLDTPYRDGGWTVRQVVHHVADSHANAYVRTKLALTEDWPTIKPYEEAEWAKLTDYQLPLEVSLQMLANLHTRWVVVLESLTSADFERGYVHPVLGRQNLAQVLALYDWHSRHHAAHIVNLRSRMGW
jgi:hypothetical protein